MQMLETTVDKFIFRVAADRRYTPEGLWALDEGSRVRIGLSDFLQQRSGDVAFVEVKDAGDHVKAGETIGSIETIKVDFELLSPLSGVISEVNPALEDAPEALNQDPYGEGWIAVIEADRWSEDSAGLLDAQAYFEHMKKEAEEEAKNL
jgi:glycine cleavage system H protein